MAENDIRTINFDNPIISCPNPNCDNKIAITIEQILKKESITCSKCHSTINLYDATGTVQKVSELKECAKSLGESIEKLTSIMSIEIVDKMTGLEFENFLCMLFSENGYKAEVTKASGDQGADLIVEKFGEKTVVQAKRYSGDVSNSAIQEVVAAKAYYNCSRAMVITNSFFTKSAVALAQANNVELCDRQCLEAKIKDFNLGAIS